MDISVFEIIGPVMVGPSSSGTAGMARLGHAAGLFLDGPLKSITLRFHPYFVDYASLGSHMALIGGILGLREYDPEIKYSLRLAQERGVKLYAGKLREPIPKESVIQMVMEQQDGTVHTVSGISVGGGSIDITEVEGFPVELDSTAWHMFVWTDGDISEQLRAIVPEAGEIKVVPKDGKYLLYCAVPESAGKAAAEIEKLQGVSRVFFVEPFLTFGYVPHEPLFRSFEDLMRISKETGKDIAEIAIDYEMDRSGRTREAIWDEMSRSLEYMRECVETGLKEDIVTRYGFGTGTAGKMMMQAIAEGKTLAGPTMGRAFAKALSVMAMDCAMNRLVAAPTGGSAGIVPGAIFTVQEDRGCSDEELIKSLFVAAACGVCMYWHGANFSGHRGGCQGEVGVSSAIAAAAICYLGGGDTEQCCHAMALALKNILGLVCDRIGGSSEVPCMTRNCMGVANAFSGCDMALAGIKSFICPDEVITALCNTQQLLPAALRGGMGACRITKEGYAARAFEKEANADLMLDPEPEEA